MSDTQTTIHYRIESSKPGGPWCQVSTEHGRNAECYSKMDVNTMRDRDRSRAFRVVKVTTIEETVYSLPPANCDNDNPTFGT